MPAPLLADLARLRIGMVGLARDDAAKYPSQLSGGMTKRAALARALALDPAILFLDEPTSGLDPISAAAFDALVLELQEGLSLTVVMITHDLDTIFRVCNRVGVIVDGRMISGTLDEIVRNENPGFSNTSMASAAAAWTGGDRWIGKPTTSRSVPSCSCPRAGGRLRALVHGQRDGEKDRRYEIYFEGGVSGLSEGGSVRYLGVAVGRVVRIGIDPRTSAAYASWPTSVKARRSRRTPSRASRSRASPGSFTSIFCRAMPARRHCRQSRASSTR
jgi:energy-coupling factor transporter ATP-binding protein EcfA2